MQNSGVTEKKMSMIRNVRKRTVVVAVFSALMAIMPYCNLRAASDMNAEDAAVEKRVAAVLAKMTLREKITMMAGVNTFYLNPPQRLGFPRIMTTDGPMGVRFHLKYYGDKAGSSTAYPATIALASSWNRRLASEYGRVHARDCRARGVHVILAPGVNIYRAPMCGRNFEYMGEDPYLAGEMAVSYVRAVQNEGVMACLKHFVCNNQEWDRYSVSSDVDERTLREIYLPAFRAVVQKGGVWSVMSAYNYINGVHASEYRHTLTDILKNEWGFRGFVISDWWSMHSCAPALNAGTDLEMPDGAHYNYKNIKAALDAGVVTQERIDDACRRILRPFVAFGFADRPQEDKSIPLLPKDAQEVALKMSREGGVLLKNRGGLLPLDGDKVKTIAVFGPNADPAITGGGGSSYVKPAKAVSVLQGIKGEFGNARVVYRKFTEENKYLGFSDIEGSYFNNPDFAGKPAVVRKEDCLTFDWHDKAPVEGVKSDNFSVRWTAVIRPGESGYYEIGLQADDRVTLYIDDREILKSSMTQMRKAIKLEAGKSYRIRLDYVEYAQNAHVNLGFRYLKTNFTEECKIAATADAVVVCVGFNPELEHEGSDRPFELPLPQEKLIEQLVAANPNTVVVLNAGGNVDMSKWIDKAAALLMAWYPGQEGGRAIAEILSGKVNPSGKLPVTFEKQWKDNPCYNSYYDNTDKPKHVRYTEGVFIGYRGYEAKNITPQFAFGFGLSYTTFKYSNLKTELKDGVITVAFDITNTGTRQGAEIAQVYVHDCEASVPRPPKELKGFERVELASGKTSHVSVNIPAESLAFYDVQSHKWKLEPGKFDILVGASSGDIRLKGSVTVK